jgi:hypothetical protein
VLLLSSLARAVSRRFPQRHHPSVFRSPTLFSTCSQHGRHHPCVFQRVRFPEGPRSGTTRVYSVHSTQEARLAAYVWWVCRPLLALFSAIAHIISSVVGPLPVSPILLLQEVPFSCVQRTGYSACGLLRLSTPGLVADGRSPHVHSSCLVPVSFAGLLIKCLHFTGTTWAFAQVRPHVALRGRLCAVWDILARGVARPGYYLFIFVSTSWCSAQGLCPLS